MEKVTKITAIIAVGFLIYSIALYYDNNDILMGWFYFVDVISIPVLFIGGVTTLITSYWKGRGVAKYSLIITILSLINFFFMSYNSMFVG